VPDIHLGDTVQGYGFAHVFAVMLFPKDSKKRDEFLAFAREQAPLEPRSSDAAAVPLYRVLNHARTHFLKSEKRVYRGSLSGEILRTLLQIHTHHRSERSDEPSVNKAIAVFARRSLIASSTLENAWANFRPAAHLWCALTVIQYSGNCDSVPADLDPSEDDGLLGFLSVAESIRLNAEKVTTRAKNGADRSSVLRPAETWKVPPAVPLLRVGIEVPPLTAPELAQLRAYKATLRR